MLLRLRRVLPSLKSLGGWAACPPSSSLAVAVSQRHAFAVAAAAGKPKRGRSVTRGAAGTDVTPSASSAAVEGAEEVANADASTSAPRRTRTSRKRTQSTAEQLGAGEAADSSAAGSAPAVASAPTGRRSRSKAPADAAEEEEEKRPALRDLPFEDVWVLPRKAEEALTALGVLRPWAGAAQHGTAENSAAAAHRPANQLQNVFQLNEFLGWNMENVAAPLLAAQYQAYLGRSPDLLYDLYQLDLGEPYLHSDDVRKAVLDATQDGGRKRDSVVTAKGTAPEPLIKKALAKLTEAVGEDKIRAQERLARGLTQAQVELFLLDWASASLTGMKEKTDDGTQYIACRTAALELTSPVVLGRLHRYIKGEGLADIAKTPTPGGKPVKLNVPMSALVEGVKAGVRLDEQRLLHDFRLGPDDPLGRSVTPLKQLLAEEAVSTASPGNAAFYNTLSSKLRFMDEFKGAVNAQEELWQKENGERDGSALTTMQLRLLFHLWRLDRFKEEHAKRLAGQADSA